MRDQQHEKRVQHTKRGKKRGKNKASWGGGEQQKGESARGSINVREREEKSVVRKQEKEKEK